MTQLPEQFPASPPAARARLIFDPDEIRYNFGADHPFQSRRLVALIDLLEKCGLWNSEDEQTRLPLRAVTIEELSLIHTADYIEAVQQLSVGDREVRAPERKMNGHCMYFILPEDCIMPGQNGPLAFVSTMIFRLLLPRCCVPAKPKCSISILMRTTAMAYSAHFMMNPV